MVKEIHLSDLLFCESVYQLSVEWGLSPTLPKRKSPLSPYHTGTGPLLYLNTRILL
jgi:hypothetical protein